MKEIEEKEKLISDDLATKAETQGTIEVEMKEKIMKQEDEIKK
jgi:hypothetical protein